MMPTSYLSIIDRLLARGRAIVRESHRYYKLYLPRKYNDVWEKLYRENKRVDILVVLKKIE